MWIGNLTEEEGWQKRMKTYFEGIFRKQDGQEVRQQVQAIWRRLERRCKEQPWEPFTAEELTRLMSKWKGGKSTGPDGVSFEALKAVAQDEYWQHAILQEFNDALYKGRLPPDIKESVTVLIPKEAAPRQWSATRPITLSTSCLKWQSQLILARTTKHILQGAVWQYAQPGKQPAELILSVRKAVLHFLPGCIVEHAPWQEHEGRRLPSTQGLLVGHCFRSPIILLSSAATST